MKPEYVNWIAALTDTYGKCGEITLAMQAAFPELVRVRGHYWDYFWGERAHWWLTDPEGSVIDPTASQFPSKGRGVYTPWIEGTPEPTGMCPNCGKCTYDGEACCSDECFKEFVASLE